MEPLLRASEVAAHLGVSLRSVRAWVASGKIPHEVLPSCGTARLVRRFRVSEVEEWLASLAGSRSRTYDLRRVGLYRRKTGKNQSDVWLYSFTVDGIRYSGTTRTSDHRAANEVYIQRYNAAIEGKHEERGGRATLSEAIEGYLRWSKAENKPGTFVHKQGLANIVLRHLDGSRRLTSLTVADVEEFKIRRKNETARCRATPPKESTINRGITFLQGLFTWALARGMITQSPFQSGAIRKYREESPVWRHLSPEEKDRLVGECGDKIRPVVVVAFATGMRMSELLNLSWRQIDLTQRTIQVVLTKSKRKRTLPIGATLAELLKRLPKRSELVFSHEDGSQLSKSYLTHEFERAVERAGLGDFTFHGLRRVFATDFYLATRDLKRLQRRLGHSSVATTERYLNTLGIIDDVDDEELISHSMMAASVGRC